MNTHIRTYTCTHTIQLLDEFINSVTRAKDEDCIRIKSELKKKKTTGCLVSISVVVSHANETCCSCAMSQGPLSTPRYVVRNNPWSERQFLQPNTTTRNISDSYTISCDCHMTLCVIAACTRLIIEHVIRWHIYSLWFVIQDPLTSNLIAFEDNDDLAMKIDTIYRKLDEDGSGGLNFAEFQLGVKSLSQHIHLTRDDFDIITENVHFLSHASTYIYILYTRTHI